MLRVITLFVFVLIMIACKDDDFSTLIVDGTYYGTFTIIESSGQTQSSYVTFIFSNNKYSCLPQKKYLPPVGAGAFTTNGNMITLTDTAIHTAEFDWTLILNGDFEYSYNGNTLTLRQSDTQHNRVRTILLDKQN